MQTQLHILAKTHEGEYLAAAKEVLSLEPKKKLTAKESAALQIDANLSHSQFRSIKRHVRLKFGKSVDLGSENRVRKLENNNLIIPTFGEHLRVTPFQHWNFVYLLKFICCLHKSNKKIGGIAESGSIQVKIGHVECSLDKASVLKNTITSHLNEGIKKYVRAN